MDRVARRGPLARAPGALKGEHFRNCQHFCRSWRGFVAKHQKIEGENFYFRKKISQCRKKTERGDPLGFSNIHSVAKQQKKIEGGPFGEKNFQKKVSQRRKKIGRGDPLVSPGMVCYAGKQETPFWFSSLDQIVHFGAIIYCRTFKNYFGQFVWIEKKVTIIVAFHFMKRRLKNSDCNSRAFLSGGPSREYFFGKSPQCQNWKGDPLVSPGIVCYKEKRKTFLIVR